MTSSWKKKTGMVSAVGAILAAVFAMEGGYVNNPADPGGETNHGITRTTATASGYIGAMRDLTMEQAKIIYVADYIEKPNYIDVIEASPAVGHKLVDAGVNAGTGRSSRWFQTSLNALNRGGKDYPTIIVDGRIGPGTITSYKGLQKVRGKVRACELVLKLMDAQQAVHYMSLSHLSGFTPGWVDNRIGNIPLSHCKDEVK